MTRRTKIVATIGPASREPETLARLVEAGMDVARLNFSHGTREQHQETAERVRRAAGQAGRQVALLQDLPGPKLRIGPIEHDLAELRSGDELTLVADSDSPGDARRMSVSWPGLADALEPDDVVYLADGSVRLRVEAVRVGEGEIDTRIEVGGAVASRQGLNVPGELTGLPAVPEEDIGQLAFGESIGVDLVALSFVRRPEDVEEVRRHTRLPLIAKIEKPQAVESIAEICRVSDCVMVARGDLGIELPIEDVPVVQKRVIACAGELARPVITATQMLDSMVTSSRPTRAEVADVANAILDGSDALMLSQETAIGEHPVETVKMMAAVAERTERIAPYRVWNEHRVHRDQRDPAYTIAYNACGAVRDLKLSALIVPTLSGRSARLISAHRPDVPIYALSPGRETVRRCSLMWGVQAASMRRHEVTEALIADAARRVVELGWCEAGERVGITAGLPSGRPGTTSLFQVQQLPSVKVSG
ncbi:MAG: pyruvate kinase [Thermoleophilaceae bacterium]